jgi:hypothetical protein
MYENHLARFGGVKNEKTKTKGQRETLVVVQIFILCLELTAFSFVGPELKELLLFA